VQFSVVTAEMSSIVKSGTSRDRSHEVEQQTTYRINTPKFVLVVRSGRLCDRNHDTASVGRREPQRN